MKRFYIHSNPNRDEGYVLRSRVEDYLSRCGAVCVCSDRDDMPPADTECVIVLGGDGTLLKTVRRFNDLGLKYIGINTGHLGYLTAGDGDMIPQICESLLRGEYVVETRMEIYARVIRDGRSIARHRALNEIVIGRIYSGKIVDLNVYLNGSLLTAYRSDGLIVSTPTGSTAYSFSAGGPIVEPTARLFVMTPLASHSLNNRSIILSPEGKLSVEIVGKPGSSHNDYQVSFDGDKNVTLQPGDRVDIAEADCTAALIKLKERSFVETLRSKISI
ncbi:MAG: NAD(+)/NADH kinase [Lachnospiraceae bacterium]|nr:NAD(+)/NADH kinase [Lachnospiraceae bacterium]